MGRWAWVDLRGTGGLITRIIMAYGLVVSSNRGGSETVVSQHLRALDQLADHRTPIDAYDEDLKHLLSSSFDQEKQIVLLIDANENVTRGVVAVLTSRFHMDEMITKTVDGTPPATHNRGSQTIDAIYASNTLLTAKGGYLPFEDSPGDHRFSSWDFTQSSIFRNCNPPPEKRSPRRLQSRIPQTVRKYHRHLEGLFVEHRLKERTESLQGIASFPAKLEVRKEYEELDLIRCRCIQVAEQKCRKLRMGATPFSPAYSANFRDIKALTLLAKKKEGKKVSWKQLQRTCRASS